MGWAWAGYGLWKNRNDLKGWAQGRALDQLPFPFNLKLVRDNVAKIAKGVLSKSAASARKRPARTRQRQRAGKAA